ncbi:unnamed protein product [Lota lota]
MCPPSYTRPRTTPLYRAELVRSGGPSELSRNNPDRRAAAAAERQHEPGHSRPPSCRDPRSSRTASQRTDHEVSSCTGIGSALAFP